MKYLLVINKKFPYQKGETFLESEMQELPEDFDDVLLFPINIAKKEKPTRTLADNVTVVPVNRLTYPTRKVKYAAGAGMRAIFKRTGQLMSSERFAQQVDELIAAEISKKIIQALKHKEITTQDEVVVYSYWLHTTARVAVLLKEHFRAGGVKCLAISRAHGFDIYEERQKNNFLPSRTYLLNKLDVIYAISENGQAYLQERYPRFARKIKISRLGTYDHGVNQISKESFHILSVSRVIPLKRLHLLVEALSQWSESPVIWTHIGDGPELEGLKKLAEKKLGHMDVRFLGFRSNQEVYEFYRRQSVDVFVNVSSTEGIPVSIMEAISFGVPVIATDVGGSREIAVQGQTGFLLPAEFDNQQLIKLLTKIKNWNQSEQQQARSSAKKFWAAHYQASANYQAFYQKVLQALAYA